MLTVNYYKRWWPHNSNASPIIIIMKGTNSVKFSTYLVYKKATRVASSNRSSSPEIFPLINAVIEAVQRLEVSLAR